MRRLFLRHWKLLLVSAGLVAACWWVLPWCVALPPSLQVAQPISVRYLAKDGSPLRMLLTREGERVAAALSFDEIPPLLRSATLAAEDKRFGHHGGVDLIAILRALRDNLSAGRILSGASTIHQQLIKVSHPARPKRTFSVKLKEALQARRLAMSWSSEEVLARYVSSISYGNSLTGCASAAQGYFDKPLSDLTPAECALLAAIPQSPTRYNPLRQPAAIRPRQQRILTKMHELGWLSAEQLRVALIEPLKLRRFHGGFEAPHAVEMLRSQSSPDHTRIQTTLDASLQRSIETIITARLATLKERHVTQAAVVVIENVSGQVLALAGSRDFFGKDGGQINGAWAPHSPGSAMKPFTYQLALERGATAATLVADLPVEYGTPTGTYRPENYAHRVYGPMTYREALGNSLNISAVKVLSRLGGTEILLKRMQELGLTTFTESAEHYGLGLTLGNAPVRLLELTNAYACLARLGIDQPWTLVPQANPKTQRLDEAACYLIADILSDNRARSLTFGQHSPLRLPFPAAVKTGTSTSYRDNWCVGYTPEYTVGVWAGNFDNSPMQDVSGVTGAAPIWRDVFLELQHRFGVTWYERPATLVQARVDPRTGKRLTAQSPPARVSRDEWFLQGHLPPAANEADYDVRGRALLSAEYATWVRSGDNWMGDLVVVEESKREQPLRILNPLSGTVIRLDPDIREGGRRLLLQAEPAESVQWQCDTLNVQRDPAGWFIMLSPGRHTLRAQHQQTQEQQQTVIIVHPE